MRRRHDAQSIDRAWPLFEHATTLRTSLRPHRGPLQDMWQSARDPRLQTHRTRMNLHPKHSTSHFTARARASRDISLRRALRALAARPNRARHFAFLPLRSAQATFLAGPGWLKPLSPKIREECRGIIGATPQICTLGMTPGRRWRRRGSSSYARLDLVESLPHPTAYL